MPLFGSSFQPIWRNDGLELPELVSDPISTGQRSTKNLFCSDQSVLIDWHILHCGQSLPSWTMKRPFITKSCLEEGRVSCQTEFCIRCVYGAFHRCGRVHSLMPRMAWAGEPTGTSGCGRFWRGYLMSRGRSRLIFGRGACTFYVACARCSLSRRAENPWGNYSTIVFAERFHKSCCMLQSKANHNVGESCLCSQSKMPTSIRLRFRPLRLRLSRRQAEVKGEQPHPSIFSDNTDD